MSGPIFEDKRHPDAGDSLEPKFEDTPHPDISLTGNEAVSDDADSFNVAKDIGIPVGVAATTKAATSGVGYVGQKTLENLGHLTPEQLNYVEQNASEYRKARDFPTLLEEFKKLGQETRDKGFNYATSAKESLKGLEPVKVAPFQQSLANIKSAPLKQLPNAEIPQPTVDKKHLERLEQLSKTKKYLEDELAKRLESGVESVGLEGEIGDLKSELTKANSEISKSIKGALEDAKNPIMPTPEAFEKATNIPYPLLEARPELKGMQLPEKYKAILQPQVDFLGGEGILTPYEIGDKYIQDLQDQATYGGIPDENTKFKQEMARNISDTLKGTPGTEEYARLQNLSSQAIGLEDQLASYGLKLDPSKKEVLISNPSKLKSLYETGNSSDIARFEKIIQKAQDLGFNPLSSIDANKMSQINRFQKELPSARIKALVKDAPESWAARLLKGVAGNTVGGPVTGVVANAVLPSGTKLQELAALAKGSSAFKVAKGVSKALPYAAGLGAGLLANAAEEGLDSEPSGATPSMPDYWLEKGVKDPEEQKQRAAAISAKENFTPDQPLGFESGTFNVQKYKQQKAYKERSLVDDPQNKKNYVEKLDTKDPEELQSILNSFQANPEDKAAQAYSNVLAKVIDAPESQKDAILFGLNQQPAFRELVRKHKGQA